MLRKLKSLYDYLEFENYRFIFADENNTFKFIKMIALKKNLKKLFVGKTLYKNGRKVMKITDAVKVNKHAFYIFLHGYPLSRNNENSHFVVTDMVARMMLSNAENDYATYWNGCLYELRITKD